MDIIPRVVSHMGVLLFCVSICYALQERYIPATPVLKAQSYVLMDYNSGQILASAHPDLPVEPASLTKMMTMYVIDQDIKNSRITLDDKVLISSKARHTPGSRMYLEQNTSAPLQDIIKGIVIQSGNDACVAVSEHLAGDEDTFAQLMNMQAKQLGMKNTTFKNATGLPQDGHSTTAYDLALLARALIKDFPESYHLYSEKSFKYNNIEQNNRNKLLWENPFVDGIKTGQTDTAGYCLASSALKEQTRLIAIVMGAESDKARTFETMKLLSYGFRFFETYKMQYEGEWLSKERVWFGQKKFVNLMVKDELYVTIPSRQQDLLRADLYIQDKIIAPVKVDQELGQLRIYLGEELLREIPIYAADPIKTGSVFSRFFEKIAFSIDAIKSYWT